jgi:hypothetical protein
MQKKRSVVDQQTIGYHQLSSYFCIQIKQNKEKSLSRLFFSRHVLLPNVYSSYVYTLLSFGWYGSCVKISPPSHTFSFFFSLTLSSSSLLFLGFIADIVAAMMYDERIYIHIYVQVCVPFVRLYVAQGFTLYIHTKK